MGFGTSGVPTDAPAINLFCHLRGWAHPSPDAGTLPRQPDRHLTFPKCIVVVIHMDATLLHIQPAAPQPIYRQIAEQIRRLVAGGQLAAGRSEEHTSELQSLMRTSYAVFCLKQKKT